MGVKSVNLNEGWKHGANQHILMEDRSFDNRWPARLCRCDEINVA